MSKHVWTYWKCATCSSIIRGDSRTCPNCGTPISENDKITYKTFRFSQRPL